MVSRAPHGLQSQIYPDIYRCRGETELPALLSATHRISGGVGCIKINDKGSRKGLQNPAYRPAVFKYSAACNLQDGLKGLYATALVMPIHR